MEGHQEQAPLFGAFRRCCDIVRERDLRTLTDPLRKLQTPYGDVFFDLEAQCARLEDELLRRSS
jgi:hypothetical protein